MMNPNHCTLPPLSDLFDMLPNASPSAVNTGASNTPESTTSASRPCPVIPQHEGRFPSVDPYPRHAKNHHPTPKAKRKRATPFQLATLNRVFSQTCFPSTELRISLGKQLGMSPRTVQIWFQNKRQSMRARERISDHNRALELSCSRPSFHTPLVSPPLSPPYSAFHPNPLKDTTSIRNNNASKPDFHDLPVSSLSPHLQLGKPASISLPPLKLPELNTAFSPLRTSSAHSSPRSIDFFF